ncbi:MAG: GTPase [Hydrogenoanaerobacterium sp.]
MEIANLAKDVLDRLNKELTDMKHVNIIVAGKTGVGKSTLINSVFREKLADTGIGAPVTKCIKELSKPGLPLRVYDTVGLELTGERQKEAQNDITQIISTAIKSGDSDRFIHCIWYCVSVDSNRFEPAEEAFIEALAGEGNAANVPVVVVLTLAHNKKKSAEMKAYIKSKNLHCKGIFCVLAEDYIDEDFCRKAYGGDELVEFTSSLLPELAQNAFANAQRASLKLKRTRAHAVVATTTAASFAEGFIPLPFADATALVPTQVGMIASITAVYGISMDKAMMSAILSSLLGTTGATIAGRTIVSNILKLVPGIGSAIGGTISGATAAMITTALGETYILLMEMITAGEIKTTELGTARVIKKVQALFKTSLTALKPKKPLQIPLFKGKSKNQHD